MDSGTRLSVLYKPVYSVLTTDGPVGTACYFFSELPTVSLDQFSDTQLLPLFQTLKMMRAFPRVAKQLNYTREFLSLEKIRIGIPGGIPYEAYDQTGGKVTPWSLMSLFESSRAFSFWPVPHASRPEDTYLDSHKLLEMDFYFIATARLDIDRDFHNFKSPKFPLFIDKFLSYVGNSAFKIDSTLLHPERSRPYATCSVQTVFVDSATRKPKALPDWWKDKYGRQAKHGSSLNMGKLEKPAASKLHTFPITVCPRDSDSYHHSNWTSYVRFCYDACVHGVAKSQYKYVTESSIGQGIQTFEITYKSESSDGDQLDIISWEDETDRNCVKFEVKKDDDVCCYAKVCFYSPDSKL